MQLVWLKFVTGDQVLLDPGTYCNRGVYMVANGSSTPISCQRSCVQDKNPVYRGRKISNRVKLNGVTQGGTNDDVRRDLTHALDQSSRSNDDVIGIRRNNFAIAEHCVSGCD